MSAVVVRTSLRSAPGLLSWPAWQALRSAPVLAADGASPHVAALREAGVPVEVVAPGEVARRAAAQDLVWLAPGGDDLPAGLEDAPVVVGAHDLPGARLLDVVAVMDRLRSPGGCPWDAAQTHASLKPYLLEEAYEAYQALEDGDPVALREELGDVLLQVAFHARLAEEAEPAWSVDDVAGDLVDKLVRRHPHVFADGSADDLEGTWDALKAAEKGRTSVTEGVPMGQPALSLAVKLQKRGTRLGAPVPAYDGLGGELWDLVRRCREQGLDPEVELRAVARRYRDELAAAERSARDDGLEPAALAEQGWVARWT